MTKVITQHLKENNRLNIRYVICIDLELQVEGPNSPKHTNIQKKFLI